ncbi:MAG: prephenate dehydrogenase [Janthinobacterium lividum]
MSDKTVIFGVGLIGGSFALALRRAGLGGRLVGVGRRAETLARAVELGIIDEAVTSVEQALDGATLVLIAAPVAQTGPILASIAPFLQPGTLVTDAGSTKSDVVAAARTTLGEKIGQFVPGHPIAGSESNGPDAAFATLYVGKKVVLTPLAENSAEDIDRVAAAWTACGAVIHRLSAALHDTVFAAVSHLPHLLAFTLVDELAQQPHHALLFDYAASGFRDFTRIAGSSPEMWRDISLANNAALLTELDAYTAHLATVRSMLANNDGAALEAVFRNAQAARQAWAAAIEAADQHRRKEDR